MLAEGLETVCERSLVVELDGGPAAWLEDAPNISKNMAIAGVTRNRWRIRNGANGTIRSTKLKRLMKRIFPSNIYVQEQVKDHSYLS